MNGGANIVFERSKYYDWSGEYYEQKKKNTVNEGRNFGTEAEIL